ncbi:hypothetical protein [Thioalbus denitrificans]|uniref:hypothetical protein n=1 Tax=Thioalbus denitrificans TaxID=547122 RepID=UPI0014727580|nr:hypothetical protein [Thioalbus denitrificans]
MPFIGYFLNSEHLEPWVWHIGKLVVNFNAIELMTLTWLEQLEKDPERHDELVNLSFGKRVAAIKSIVGKTAVSENLKQEIRDAWGKTKEIARVRNSIGHNPVIFGWHTEDGQQPERPPDFIGPLNVKNSRNSGGAGALIVEFDQITNAIDDSVAGIQRLHDLLIMLLDEMSKTQST